MKLRGVYTALVTPFQPNGEIDLQVFRTLCERQLQAGVHGLVPCGTTGETPTLSSSEWQALIKTAVDVSNGRYPVIAGCGTNNTATTVDNIQKAKAIGADAALVVFPYYNKPNPSGLLLHIEAACEVGLPVVLYHVPGRTGQQLPATQLETLCRVSGVTAIKEATGDVALGIDLIQRLADTDVSVLSGDDFTFAALTAMGGDGVISVISNPAPSLTTAWFHAADKTDRTLLMSLSSHLTPVVQYLFSDTNPAPVKAMMSKMNLCADTVRLPLAVAKPPSKVLIRDLK